MKSKYTQIVKIQKRNFDLKESQLMLKNKEKVDILNQVLSSKKDLNEVNLVSSGDFVDILQTYSLKNAYSTYIKGLKDNIEIINQQIMNLKKELNIIYIELEKFKELEKVDLEKQKKDKKKKEQLEFDEISIMMYKQKVAF